MSDGMNDSRALGEQVNRAVFAAMDLRKALEEADCGHRGWRVDVLPQANEMLRGAGYALSRTDATVHRGALPATGDLLADSHREAAEEALQDALRLVTVDTEGTASWLSSLRAAVSKAVVLTRFALRHLGQKQTVVVDDVYKFTKGLDGGAEQPCPHCEHVSRWCLGETKLCPKCGCPGRGGAGTERVTKPSEGP